MKEMWLYFVPVLLLISSLTVILVSHAQIHSDLAPYYLGGYLEYTTFSNDPIDYTAYKINGWAEGSVNILNISKFLNFELSEFIYVSIPSWNVTTSNGVDLGYYFTPPLWQNTTMWIDGENITLTPDFPEFFAQSGIERITPAGTFNCWALIYIYNETDYSGDIGIYYDFETGVLVNFWNFIIMNFPNSSSYYTADFTLSAVDLPSWPYPLTTTTATTTATTTTTRTTSTNGLASNSSVPALDVILTFGIVIEFIAIVIIAFGKREKS